MEINHLLQKVFSKFIGDKKLNTIAIIDYGMGNLSSVLKAVNYVAPNDTVIVSSDPNVINSADKIIFPGQGAAKRCMESIYRQKSK